MILFSLIFWIIRAHLIQDNDRWIEYASSEKYIFYFDKIDVKKLPNGHLRVWIKERPRSEYANQVRAEMIEEHKKMVGYDENQKPKYDYGEWRYYSYTKTLEEWDCVNSRAKALSIIDYEIGGDVLSTFDPDDPKWSYTVPGSTGEALEKIVCQ